MSQPPNTMSSSLASGTKSLISGERLSVRLPSRMVPICVSEPIGLASPRRMASTPGDERGRDRAHAGQQDAELAARRRDLASLTCGRHRAASCTALDGQSRIAKHGASRYSTRRAPRVKRRGRRGQAVPAGSARSTPPEAAALREERERGARQLGVVARTDEAALAAGGSAGSPSARGGPRSRTSRTSGSGSRAAVRCRRRSPKLRFRIVTGSTGCTSRSVREGDEASNRWPHSSRCQ